MIFSSVQSLHSQKSKIRKSEIKRKNEVSAFVLKLKYRFIVNLSEAAIFFWKKSKFARASRVQWFKSDNFTFKISLTPQVTLEQIHTKCY
jgi:hypothetical protein